MRTACARLTRCSGSYPAFRTRTPVMVVPFSSCPALDLNQLPPVCGPALCPAELAGRGWWGDGDGRPPRGDRTHRATECVLRQGSSEVGCRTTAAWSARSTCVL